jgi:hypothetical protein
MLNERQGVGNVPVQPLIEVVEPWQLPDQIAGDLAPAQVAADGSAMAFINSRAEKVGKFRGLTDG